MKNLCIALVGNPNCGKTTLFNQLTGSKQKVANFSGVTVDCHSGWRKHHHTRFQFDDLPGLYSIPASSQQALDTKIVQDYLITQSPDVIVNIVDASNLERNLYLTLQLLELEKPIVIALNMMDRVTKQKKRIDCLTLSRQLKCPVVPIIAELGKGIPELLNCLLEVHQEKNHLSGSKAPSLTPAHTVWPNEIMDSVQTLQHSFIAQNTFLTQHEIIHGFEGELHHVLAKLSAAQKEAFLHTKKELEKKFEEEMDCVIAACRYEIAHQLNHSVVSLSSSSEKKGKKNLNVPSSSVLLLDKFLLHRLFGLPLFLLIMYALFSCSISLGNVFKDFFDISTETIFVQQFAHFLTQWHAPDWMIAVFAAGLGRGLNTTFTFIPVLIFMFLGLSFLENSGYIARAAFLMDRLMRLLGLPGKAFVPMLIGFGCNVPAILGTRTLECARDRLLAILMMPFMSCSARLVIYSVFVTTFFSHGGQDIVFGLYLLGIFSALITGWILRGTLLPGGNSPLILELPPYQWPRFTQLGAVTLLRLRQFLWRAGKVIVPICILIGALNAISSTRNISTGNSEHLILFWIGKTLTPLFSPMGITPDNWPATVGLLTGVIAKELVIGTLNGLYSQVGHLPQAISTESFSLLLQLKTALHSIKENILALPNALLHPLDANVTDVYFTKTALAEMYVRFHGTTNAIAYLIFVLLYIPCISTVAVTWRELNFSWALFSIFWNTGFAYLAATLFFQFSSISHNPNYHISIVVFIGLIILVSLLGLRYIGKRYQHWMKRG